MPRLKAILLLAVLSLPLPAWAADRVRSGTLYKDPDCDCCEGYADYLRQNGYQIKIVPTRDLAQMRAAQHVPEDLAGCHMTLIDGYVVEGHVAVSMVNRMLDEKPAIRGISLIGMPPGTPGMPGDKIGPYTVWEIAAEHQEVPARVFGVQ